MNAPDIITPPETVLTPQPRKSALLITDSEETASQFKTILPQLEITLHVIPYPRCNPVETHRLGLVFLDTASLSEPVSSVCAQLKSNLSFSSVPFILITPAGQPEMTLNGLKAGADDFIHTPIQPYELLIRVRSHLTKEAWREQTAAAKERNLIMAELFAGLNQGLHLNELLDLFLQEMIVHSHCFQSCFYLIPPDTEKPSWINPLNDPLNPIHESILNELKNQSSPLWIEWKTLETSRSGEGSFAALFPVSDTGKLLGVLALRYDKDRPADPSRLVSTSVITDILAVIIARYHMEAAIELYVQTMQRDLENLGYMQQLLLPQHLPEISGLEMAAFYSPAHQAGGDYYDVIPLTDEHTAFIMADVSGHGAPAAMNMGIARSIIHTVGLSQQTQPHLTVYLLNKLLCRLLGKGMYITLFYAVFNKMNHRLEWCNAGHVPAILIQTDLKTTRIIGDPSSGPALGWWNNAEFDHAAVQLNPNDTVLFYTDGLTEAMNQDQQEYSLDRLISLLNQTAHLNPQALIEHIKHDVFQFIGSSEIQDDIALLTLSLDKNL